MHSVSEKNTSDHLPVSVVYSTLSLCKVRPLENCKLQIMKWSEGWWWWWWWWWAGAAGREGFSSHKNLFYNKNFTTLIFFLELTGANSDLFSIPSDE